MDRLVRTSSAALLGALLTAAVVAPASGSQRAGIDHRYLIGAERLPGGELVVEVLGATGRLERVVGQAGLSRSGAKWSPDGSRLAWVARRGVTVERADGSRRRLLVTKLPDCSYNCLTFAWSPDGKRLAVGNAVGDNRDGEKSRLLVVTVKDGRKASIAPLRAHTQYAVLGWSPDGRSIVYRRDYGGRTAAECCQLDLVVSQADGRGAQNLFTFHDAIDTGVSASWSPDSHSIAFTSSDSKDPHDPGFGVIDVATGEARALRRIDSAGQPPTWSPNGRRLAVSSNQRGVITLAPNGGAVRTLAPHAGMAVWTRRGDVIVVQGRGVFQSRDGRERARPVFGVPKDLAITSIDPTQS